MWIEFLVVDDGRDSHPFVVFWIRLWLIHDRMPHRRRSMGDSCPRRSPWLQRTMQEPSLIQQTGHWASKEPLWIKNPQHQRRHCVQNYREHRTSGSPLEDPLARRDQMVRPNKNFRVPKERRNGITSFFLVDCMYIETRWTCLGGHGKKWELGWAVDADFSFLLFSLMLMYVQANERDF